MKNKPPKKPAKPNSRRRLQNKPPIYNQVPQNVTHVRVRPVRVPLRKNPFFMLPLLLAFLSVLLGGGVLSAVAYANSTNPLELISSIQLFDRGPELVPSPEDSLPNAFEPSQLSSEFDHNDDQFQRRDRLIQSNEDRRCSGQYRGSY